MRKLKLGSWSAPNHEQVGPVSPQAISNAVVFFIPPPHNLKTARMLNSVPNRVNAVRANVVKRPNRPLQPVSTAETIYIGQNPLKATNKSLDENELYHGFRKLEQEMERTKQLSKVFAELDKTTRTPAIRAGNEAEYSKTTTEFGERQFSTPRSTLLQPVKDLNKRPPIVDVMSREIMYEKSSCKCKVHSQFLRTTLANFANFSR